MRKLTLLTYLLVLFFLGGCTSAKTLTIKDAWARPAPAGQNSAAYFVIVNRTSTDDVLLSASSEVATATELHMSMMEGEGVMSMKPMENVPISAGEKVTFQPGGMHVMFINLKQDLKAGESLKLTLVFEKTGIVTIEVPIKE